MFIGGGVQPVVAAHRYHLRQGLQAHGLFALTAGHTGQGTCVLSARGWRLKRGTGRTGWIREERQRRERDSLTVRLAMPLDFLLTGGAVARCRMHSSQWGAVQMKARLSLGAGGASGCLAAKVWTA